MLSKKILSIFIEAPRGEAQQQNAIIQNNTKNLTEDIKAFEIKKCRPALFL